MQVKSIWVDLGLSRTAALPARGRRFMRHDLYNAGALFPPWQVRHPHIHGYLGLILLSRFSTDNAGIWLSGLLSTPSLTSTSDVLPRPAARGDPGCGHMVQNQFDARLRRAADDLDEAMRAHVQAQAMRSIRGASAAARARAGILEREHAPCTRPSSRVTPKGTILHCDHSSGAHSRFGFHHSISTSAASRMAFASTDALWLPSRIARKSLRVQRSPRHTTQRPGPDIPPAWASPRLRLKRPYDPLLGA
jgi:hypothetical protein